MLSYFLYMSGSVVSIKRSVQILLCRVCYKWLAVETWKHPCNDWGYGLCYVVPVNLYCGSIQSSSRRGGTTSKVLQRRDYDRWYKHARTTGSRYFHLQSTIITVINTLDIFHSSVYFIFCSFNLRQLMMVFDCNEQNHSLDRNMIKMIYLP